MGIKKIFKPRFVENPDVTGAGDTVISILTACFLSGEDITKSVDYSNTAASLSVQKLGSTSVSQDELFNV